MIKALLLRRYWLIRHRFRSTISFMILFPLMFHTCITLVLEDIIVLSVYNISYQVWVFPGVIFLISAASTYTIIYRDFFDLRIHRISFLPITLAPYGKTYLILGFILTSIIESFFHVLVSMIVLTVLMSESLHWNIYLLTPIFAFAYSYLLANIMVTFAIISDRIFTFLSFSILMFLFIIFGTGMILEFDSYPQIIGQILTYNPLSMILSELRNILFFNYFEWAWLVIPVVVSIIWTIFNGLLLKRKLKQ